MAVHATPVEDSLVGKFSRSQIPPRQKVVGVTEAARLVMALIAQKGRGRDEELLVIRAMRIVASQAAFDDRGMLPEKWPALFGVALVTQLIHAVGQQKRPSCRSMRRVTIVAVDLAFEERHVGTLVELRALLRVTREAGFGDALFREKTARSLFGHRVVTIAASQALEFVDRSGPVDTGTARVARKADVVSHRDTRIRLAGERDDLIAILRVLGVLGARSVAPLAAELLEFVSWALRQAPVNGSRPMIGFYYVARPTIGLADVRLLGCGPRGGFGFRGCTLGSAAQQA